MQTQTVPKIKIKAKLNPKLTPSLKTEAEVLHTTNTCRHSILPCSTNKLAMFDLDDTIYKKDTTVYCTGALAMLQRAHDQGYHIVVFSNQYGISKGHTTHSAVESRISELRLTSGLRISVLYSTEKDKYRKPMVGMYDLFLEHINVKTPDPASYYCGDAAGRQGDFAVSDRYFASNIGVQFLTPDAQLPPIALKHDLYRHLDLHSMIVPDPINMDELKDKTLVIMVGPQGAGKSTMSELIVSRSRSKGLFHRLNRDTLGSKLMSQFTNLLSKDHSMIIDNMNGKKSDRNVYISAAKKSGYTVVCFYFDIPKEFSIHMCDTRTQLGGKRIPPVARHTYYKYKEAPTLTENIDIIHIVRGIPSYIDNPIPKEYYYLYNLADR